MYLTTTHALCSGTEKWSFCLLPIVWKRNKKRKTPTFEFFSRWSLHFWKSLLNGQHSHNRSLLDTGSLGSTGRDGEEGQLPYI